MQTNEGIIMGIYPKIGITGLPRSGKSAVLQKVIQMVQEERKNNSRKKRSIKGTYLFIMI